MSNVKPSRRFLYHNTDAALEELHDKIEEREARRRKRRQKQEHIAWCNEQRAKEIEKTWQDDITKWARLTQKSLWWIVKKDKTLKLRQMIEALDRSKHSKTWRQKLRKGTKGGRIDDVFPIFLKLIIEPRDREMRAEREAFLLRAEIADKKKKEEEEKRKADEKKKDEEKAAAKKKSIWESATRDQQGGGLLGPIEDSSSDEDTNQNATAPVVYASSSSPSNTPSPFG